MPKGDETIMTLKIENSFTLKGGVVTGKRMLGKCHESSLRLTKLNLKRKEERKLMLGVEGTYKYTNSRR